MSTAFLERCTAAFWTQRVDDFAAQTPDSLVTHIVVHSDEDAPHRGAVLYTWDPKVDGAHAGRRYIVTMDDGRVLGPGSNLWFRGRIPDGVLHRFAPNARLKLVRPARSVTP